MTIERPVYAAAAAKEEGRRARLDDHRGRAFTCAATGRVGRWWRAQSERRGLPRRARACSGTSTHSSGAYATARRGRAGRRDACVRLPAGSVTTPAGSFTREREPRLGPGRRWVVQSTGGWTGARRSCFA